MEKRNSLLHLNPILKKGALKLELTFSTASSLSASTNMLVAASSNSYDFAYSNAYVIYDLVDDVLLVVIEIVTKITKIITKV